MLTIRTRRNPLHARFPEVLVLVAYISSLLMVSCEVAEVLDRGAERLLKEENDIFAKGTNNYKRRYKLYNHCSERQVEILSEGVNAKGSKDSVFTNIIVDTVHSHSHNHYGVNIIGEKSGAYLCFNKKGKLITRISGHSPRCRFKELISPDTMYTTFRSTFNTDWFIGFNRKGKSLPGFEHMKSRRSRCFYFTKSSHSYLNFHNRMYVGPKIHHPNKLKNYLRQQRLKRHAKWRIR